jgi:exopolysaccharide biosynthesis protein
MADKTRKHSIPVWLTVLFCVVGVLIGLLFTGWSYLKMKYAGTSHPALSRQLTAGLAENSLTYQAVRHFYTDDELAEIRTAPAPAVASDGSENVVAAAAINTDPNGDGIEIQHVHSSTFEGYMMILRDPGDAFIALNPGMSTGAAGPNLPEFISQFDAVAGINGGGFVDNGGNGNGGIPAGIVISGGRIVQDGTSAVIAFTDDHKLIATTASASELLAMGVKEAITFGPTFIHEGRNVYVPTSDLNMLNPRTAVGMQADGTLLLLVIDGRGPSSWGAKYEDVLKIFQDYQAVEAGNLDGGNSSVMWYNGGYVNDPVSMYGSRRLPDAILVRKGGRKNG